MEKFRTVVFVFMMILVLGKPDFIRAQEIVHERVAKLATDGSRLCITVRAEPERASRDVSIPRKEYRKARGDTRSSPKDFRSLAGRAPRRAFYRISGKRYMGVFWRFFRSIFLF